jgi:hypothetical protein
MDLPASSPHMRVLHTLQFIVAVLIDQESALVFVNHKSRSSSEPSMSGALGDSVRILDAIYTLSESVAIAANALRRSVGSEDPHRHPVSLIRIVKTCLTM